MGGATLFVGGASISSPLGGGASAALSLLLSVSTFTFNFFLLKDASFTRAVRMVEGKTSCSITFASSLNKSNKLLN